MIYGHLSHVPATPVAVGKPRRAAVGVISASRLVTLSFLCVTRSPPYQGFTTRMTWNWKNSALASGAD